MTTLDAKANAHLAAMDGRIKPIKALRAFLALMRNKEDSAQVVHFRTSVDGPWYEPMIERFKADPRGRAILDRGVWLFDVLSDQDYLLSLPEGSLGRVFVDELIERGLTPQGLRDADIEAQDLSLLGEEGAFVHYRLLDMHDLLHTITGFGRDPLGEICIVEFQGVQFGSRGFRLLSHMAILEIVRRFPDTPALKCVREANRMASNAVWLATADWESLLPLPIEDVRRTLNITPSPTYSSVHDIWQERDLLLQREMAAA